MPLSRDLLIAHGFVPTRYADDPGEYLTRTMKASELASFPQRQVENELDGRETAVAEVLPDGKIQFMLSDRSSVYDQVDACPIDSDAGLAILRDIHWPADAMPQAAGKKTVRKKPARR